MQLIFKYDIDRLTSYATNAENNIQIADRDFFTMLSFPEVEYFNYAFTAQYATLSNEQIDEIEGYYCERDIAKHKIIVSANCLQSNQLLQKHKRYKQTAGIAKTCFIPPANAKPSNLTDLEFIKATHDNIDLFARLYLESFESEKKVNTRVVENFRSLLKLNNLELFLLKSEKKYVGVNVLYQSKTESLLAGGAILPEHRNRGFHQQGLKFRINKAAINNTSKKIVAWAYNPSVSLRNMLKLKMEVLENFNVYEYSK